MALFSAEHNGDEIDLMVNMSEEYFTMNSSCEVSNPESKHEYHVDVFIKIEDFEEFNPSPALNLHLKISRELAKKLSKALLAHIRDEGWED